MLSWAQRKKILFLGWITLFLAVAAGLYFITAFSSRPNCGNGVQDGNERGVDCGGVCIKICFADTEAPLVHFVRPVPVSEGVWGAIAYLENRNAGAGARNVPYTIKLYDTENLLIAERHGTVFIPPRKTFAVFEGNLASGGRVPVRASFDFSGAAVFERMEEVKLSITVGTFAAAPQASSLEATLRNITRDTAENVTITALLYGQDGNVFAASATFVGNLPAGRNAPLTFTWPRELPHPVRVEVLYAAAGR